MNCIYARYCRRGGDFWRGRGGIAHKRCFGWVVGLNCSPTPVDCGAVWVRLAKVYEGRADSTGAVLSQITCV